MPKWLKPLADSAPGRFITHIVNRYIRHDVDRQGAALAYYLLFAIFPFLIFLSSLLGLLELDISAIVQALSPILPVQVLEVAETYLNYVSQTSSSTILWFSLVFTIYFPMRAAKCLMFAVRRAYHLPAPKNRFIYTFKILLYTVFLLVTIALSLVLATVGERVLEILGRWIDLPVLFVELWMNLRFVVLGVVVFAAVGLLYVMAQDERQSAGDVLPGAAFSLVVWLVLSAVYSFYVENFSNYSLIYGTLGTVIVLLIWLYLTAVVLIMGAEMNDSLIALRRERALHPAGRRRKHGSQVTEKSEEAEKTRSPGEEKESV